MGVRFMPPCGDCDRKGCGAFHNECEKYKQYREIKDGVNNERHKHNTNTWQGKYEEKYAPRTRKRAEALKRKSKR